MAHKETTTVTEEFKYDAEGRMATKVTTTERIITEVKEDQN